MTRKLHLNALFHPSGEHLAGWRHPDAPADAATNFAYLRALVEKLEAAKFDALFIADLVGVPDSKPAVLERVAVVNDGFEPTTLLAAVSAFTTNIGLIATASSSYSEPYSLARTFASLDHLSKGRAGWNLVTSLNDSEARNYGLDDHPLHGDRYARAEEFHDVVSGLWDSFGDDAFVRDSASGRYFDPAQLRSLNHRGEHFTVAGPLNIPRSPQGRPVIAQAGASEAGRALASRIGEVIFSGARDIHSAKEYYSDLKRRAVELGRSESDLLVFPGLTPIVAPTLAEAEDQFEALESLLHPVVGLGDLEYWLGGVDLTQFDLDGPLPELPVSNKSISTQQGIYQRARERNLSIRDFAREAGRGDSIIVGTASDIADHIEEWFIEGAADGFNVVFPFLPTTLHSFADLVVPELQRRGLFRTEYEGTTLRENLGLTRPERRAAA